MCVCGCVALGRIWGGVENGVENVIETIEWGGCRN